MNVSWRQGIPDPEEAERAFGIERKPLRRDGHQGLVIDFAEVGRSVPQVIEDVADGPHS